MRLFATLTLTVLILAASGAQAQIYVDASATGSNDGSSWTDAYVDLQDALASATNGDEVWVAAGTYKPDGGFDRAQTFQLITGVEIYGGFAGGEVNLSERDVQANPTVLSGDIGIVSDASDNSYHVVTGTGTTATAVLDGFTVTDGNADGSNFSGGGMIIVNSDPTINSVRFYSNNALFNGGGMYTVNSPSSITNVVFENNSAGQNGGGLSTVSSLLTLANVLFLDNTAVGDGGGMYNFSGSTASITNCLFHGNVANAGGAIGNSTSSPVIANTIIWNNNATSKPSINNAGISQPPIANSLIEGSGGSGAGWSAQMGMDGGGNEDRNPAFVDEANDDFHLEVASPGTNGGDNGATGLPATDLDGQVRISGGTVDMDLYEHQFVCHGGSRLYVKQLATGLGDGSSWDNAMAQLRDALVTAEVCGGITEIWVAVGVYQPTATTDDRSMSFVMRTGLALYGGFAGTESDPAERDVLTNPSILTGIIGGPDEVFHVVEAHGTDATAVLDGFRVQFGAGEFLSGVSFVGGGLYSIAGSPTVRNTTFWSNNNGYYNSGGSPTLENVTFQAASQTALRNEDGGVMTATDCVFQNNSGSTGGAVFNSGSTLTLTNPVFQANLASFGGGAFHNDKGGSVTVNGGLFQGSTGTAVRCRDSGSVINISDATFILNEGGSGGCINATGGYTLNCNNVVFDDNTAGNLGGALYLTDVGDVTLTDVVFTDNDAANFGGAIFSEVSMTMKNGLFFGNTSDGGGAFSATVYPTSLLLNVAFASNDASTEGGAVLHGGAVTFRNSILWGNQAPVGPNISPNTVSAYEACIVEGSGGSGAWDSGFGTDLGGNLDTDPLFVDELNGDLHLSSTSPAIDAGVNVAGLPLTDLDGFDRIVGPFVDMGPYEHDPTTGIDDENAIPRSVLRLSTYPNPFNPTLTVEFELDRPRLVTVAVYTVAGERVRTLTRDDRPAGQHVVVWDATDAAGRRVATGIYVVRIDADDWRDHRKVLLLK